MPRMRVPGGYRRGFKSGDVGGPRKVRALLKSQAEELDACRFPADCGCVACRPDPYDETDDRA
jgi:hypothetical protein